MDNQELKLKGTLMLELRDVNGVVKESRRKDNIITTVGFDLIMDALGKSASRPAVISHIAVGTGSTAVASSQTTLVSELNRQAATYSHTAGTPSFTMTATYAAGVATGAITEAGVFNASSAGIMLDRVVFSVINKGADDSLTATFQFTLS